MSSAMLDTILSQIGGWLWPDVSQVHLAGQQQPTLLHDVFPSGRYAHEDGSGQTAKFAEPILRFKPDDTFQISIFEDLHFGENAWEPWGPQQDLASVDVMETLLDSDPADLVVLNGDLITGENSFLENATEVIDQIVKPMVRRGLPWASTYGNHDHQYNVSGSTILVREARFEGSLTRNMVADPAAGVSNYYLPVFGTECRQRHGSTAHCVPELLLWFFDSRGGFHYQEKNVDGTLVGQENWVHGSAVAWFRRTHARLTSRHGRAIPSLAFTHIPVHAAAALQSHRGRGSIDARRTPGINDDYPLAAQADGWCADGRDGAGCAYGGQDVPFMRALAEAPGMLALFSGHDHGDTWCHRWEGRVRGVPVRGSGMSLCFGQRSGYGGYGSWIRGARQVLVSREMLDMGELQTWIRLETGDVVGSVTLNETYGRDEYGETPNDKTRCPTCEY